MQHIISVKQLEDKKLLQELFDFATKLKKLSPVEYPKPLQDKIIATLFFEPSTRTRLSFETATQRLGGKIISTENASISSSNYKGETLEDTIRVINSYADGIVMRHPETGSAARAAAVSKIPIINAGDGGAGEHPTQGLLDVYTIYESKGTFDGLKVGMVGDLLNGRTMHSTLQLLSMYDVEFYFFSPKSLSLPKSYLQILKKQGRKFTELYGWDDALKHIDALYMTRVQKERFKKAKDYLAVKDDFILTKSLTRQLKKDAIILHPLPRINEIPPEIDADPRALYFEQARNGLFTRMSLLNHLYS